MGETALIEHARAKINLTLHVGPLDNVGYHPLKSLVVFADIYDVLSVTYSQSKNKPGLKITGAFADDLDNGEDNLVLRAANIVGAQTNATPSFTLTKNLPVASGIGGGSADAAATVRLLCRGTNRSPDEFSDVMSNLGSDIPVCLNSQTSIMGGCGETVTLVPDLGQIHAILVNPGVAVSTRDVFRKFDNTPPRTNALDHPRLSGSLLDIASTGRNDLQPSSISLCPEIGTVLDAVESQPMCQLARMSGSGATCFGIFPTKDAADQAVKSIASRNPDWWCVSTVLGDTV